MQSRSVRLKTGGVVLTILGALSLVACAPTEAEQRAQLRCAGGVVTGAAVGGFLGNQLGGGTGRAITTAGGAAAGGALGANAAC